MRFNGCVALFGATVATCACRSRCPPARRPRPSRRPRRAALPDQTSNAARPRFAGLQNGLDEDDEIAALEAIRIALSEVGDGSKFVWRRANGRISGVIVPTSSFKDADGRVCRHLMILLAAGRRTSKIEGIACRLGNGRWQLEG